MKKYFSLFLMIILSLLWTSCSDDNDIITPGDTSDEPSDLTPFQELYDQGIDRYLSAYTPTSTSSPSSGVTEYFLRFPMDQSAILVVNILCLREMVAVIIF
jgi:hypothetical protein